MAWLNECTSQSEMGGGRYRMAIAIKPRAYWRPTAGGGRVLAPIPTAWEPTGDPGLPHGRAGLLDTRFTEKLAGQSPQVHVGRGLQHVRLVALGTNNNVAGAPVLDNTSNVIGRRYNGAWNGADLEWLDGGHYVKKHVYLQAGHPSLFEIRVDDRAGVLVASSRGWDLQDDAGRPVLWAGRGFLFKPDDPSALTVPVTTTVRVSGGKSIYRYELPAGDWAGWVLEPTWTSQPGAAEGQDGELLSWAPNNNQGIYNNLGAGTNNGTSRITSLIAFTLIDLPTSALISNATLTLYDTAGVARPDVLWTVDCFRVLSSWIEGTGDGSTTALAGEPTYAYRIYDTVAWDTGGCRGAGVDYATTLMGSTPISDSSGGARNFSLFLSEFALLRASNNGMVLRGSDEDTASKLVWFASSDHATAAWRPKLTIEYSLSNNSRVPRSWLLRRP